MKNLHKNQPPCPPIAQFLRTVGGWLIAHAKDILDFVCLLVGLAMCYGLLLIGGAM